MNHDDVTLTKYLHKKLKPTDETLPNFIKKREHPRKGEKKKQGVRTKVQGKQTAQMKQATRRRGNH
jgi:hypothetical protein